VSLGKLKRTLHREFTRNPAKSCTLLALLPVAGYFIGPLVWKQLPGAKAPESTQMAQVLVTDIASATVSIGTGSATGPQPLPTWQQVARWIEQDARMKPSTTVSLRDPFCPISKPLEQESEQKKQNEQAVPSAASLRPEDCGLELTATIVGTAKRLATISGRLYSENARIHWGDTPGSPQASSPTDDPFVLKTVAKNYVVLERHGESFQLPLVRAAEK